MTPVVGIDPSLTATGVAWPDGSTEVIKWPHRGVERLDAVYQWVSAAVTCCYVDGTAMYTNGLVLLEGYAHGKGNQAHQMGELGGVLRLVLYHQHVPFLIVPPAVVKKYATGKGNANKDLVRDAARDRLGPLEPGITSDECDALWLRQIGLRITGGMFTPVPKVHASALDKLDLGAWKAVA